MKIEIDKELFQWDKNRCLTISLNDSETSPSVLQFYNSKSPEAIEREFFKDKNTIPNELLKDYLPIVVLACSNDGEETKVLHRKEFKVLKRPRPENYIDDDLSIELIYDGGVEI